MELEVDQTQQQLTSVISRVMKIESVTVENPDASHIVARYRGHLIKDSVEAYDQLAEALKPLGYTPLFKNDHEMHLIEVMDGVLAKDNSNPWVNLILFLFTLVSVLFAGTMYGYEGPMPEGEGGLFLLLLKNLHLGLPFALSMLAILLAHEFGHYLAARYHKTAVTLPYFIPFPLSLFGTMGAFIQLKAPPKNKRVLHDIGVAGPLAGLVVAIPILLVGLYLSPVTVIDQAVPEGSILTFEGNSLFYLAAKFVIHGELLPAPASYGDVSPFVYWVRYLFTGHPAPLGNRDVLMHPLAWAGWAGLLITSLNLIPAGQLDGGHALYVLLGDKANKILPFILGGLGLLGLAWSGWWLWFGLIFLFGRRHAEPLDQITQLNPERRAIAVLTLVLFVLLFIPIPLQQFVS